MARRRRCLPHFPSLQEDTSGPEERKREIRRDRERSSGVGQCLSLWSSFYTNVCLTNSTLNLLFRLSHFFEI